MCVLYVVKVGEFFNLFYLCVRLLCELVMPKACVLTTILQTARNIMSLACSSMLGDDNSVSPALF